MDFIKKTKQSRLKMAETADCWKFKYFFVVLIIIGPYHAFAHKHHHSSTAGSADQAIYQVINESYIREVKPIFQKKCFDCHSSQTKYPWYHQVPGIRGMINNDIKEALEHLDFESDFPFKSHATPVDDVDAIGEEIEKNEMPPFRYRVLHSGSALTDEEKNKVINWVQFSKTSLKEKSN